MISPISGEVALLHSKSVRGDDRQTAAASPEHAALVPSAKTARTRRCTDFPETQPPENCLPGVLLSSFPRIKDNAVLIYVRLVVMIDIAVYDVAHHITGILALFENYTEGYLRVFGGVIAHDR